MASSASNGYLLIADISGYTSYVATTEIEHSQAILAELLELLIKHTQPMLTLSKLEGDAIFCYTPREKITRGESLLEMVEVTYAAFRSRVDSIALHTTCDCNACRAIPILDLKFLVHFGEYFIQKVAHTSELLGSDVNLIHRLTKNNVSQGTGWNAYLLLTEAALFNLEIGTEGLHNQPASYEHLGEVQTFSMNLRARYTEMVAQRRVVVTEEEEHAHYIMEFAVPPAILWDWMSDPHKRDLWQPGNRWSGVLRPGGRTTVGATNHCSHGKDELVLEIIRDWRPFEYFTVEVQQHLEGKGLIDNLETVYLEPLNDGQRTRMTSRIRMAKQGPIGRLLGWGIYRFFMLNSYKLLDTLTSGESQAVPAQTPELEIVG